MMEVLVTEKHFILMKNKYELWWNRISGEFLAKTGTGIAPEDAQCLGVARELIGVVGLEGVIEPRMLLIKEATSLGKLPGGTEVYNVRQVVALLRNASVDSLEPHLGLKPCPRHTTSVGMKGTPTTVGGRAGQGLVDIRNKAWGTLKSAGNTLKTTTQHAAEIASSKVKGGEEAVQVGRQRRERRLAEELLRLFNESDAFYFMSMGGDLTNSLQRYYEAGESGVDNIPLWERVDDRFFWNRHMIKDVIALGWPIASPWVIPLIQGFVQLERCRLDADEILNLCLVSRRSRFRAGTRLQRRGANELGNVANYVETEQIASFAGHVFAWVQVRGSVPLFWSQPGLKYRPPPRLERSSTENQSAFEKHINDQLKRYGSPLCLVSLIEQQGKEAVLGRAFSERARLFNSSDLTYATFDLHARCRGLRFDRVSSLISALDASRRQMSFWWADGEGPLCRQRGVFRFNCVDCLDRTNVVQTAVAKVALESQLAKLGRCPPLPQAAKNALQTLWANNGDALSRQYAGTDALKGDVTRTGTRRLAGLMKDGVNSANRYYLSRFKDVTRQAAIDLVLGEPVSLEALGQATTPAASGSWGDEEAAHVRALLDDCRLMVPTESEEAVASWGLIDADPETGDPAETDMDSILILTRESYYLADYDEALDRVGGIRRIPLSDLTQIELGPPEQGTAASLFKAAPRHCIRIHYKIHGREGYFHQLRATNLRFFNTLAVPVHTEDESVESLRAICEAICATRQVAQLPPLRFVERRLPRLRSLPAPPQPVNVTNTSPSRLDPSSAGGLSRNLSESRLGSSAISGATTPKPVSITAERSPGPLDAHLDTVGILMAAPEPTQSPSSTTAWLGDSLKEAKNMNTSKLNTSSMKLAPPNTLALYSSEEGSHELGSGGGSMASLLGSPLVSPISRLARLSVKALGGGEPEPEGASEQAWENSSTHLIAL